MKFPRSRDWWWNEWIKPVLIAAVLALFIRTFIAQPFKIPTNSMYPTLQPGDRIFVNKFLYGARIPFSDIRLPGLRAPMLGDIVVFTSPVEKKKYLVKRYIAGGGESVHILNGDLFVNGKKIKDKPFDDFFYYKRGDHGTRTGALKIPEKHFYVLGDNSANSMDSRYWGVVPERNLVGRAFVIHWPLNRIRLIRGGK